MAFLSIENLCANVNDTPILRGVDLAVELGCVDVVMGPNGSGKSTLANVLAGSSGYDLTDGVIHLDGEEITALAPEERVRRGLFMAFQYPVELPGVRMPNLLRESLNAVRTARGQKELEPIAVVREARQEARRLGIDEGLLARDVNAGLSGGEKKQSEVLQMALMRPKLALLDETDSGLDIDALKMVAGVINDLRDDQHSFLIVTHYRRLLDYIKPDAVHIMIDGRIVRSGAFDLVEHVETHGYAEFRAKAA